MEPLSCTNFSQNPIGLCYTRQHSWAEDILDSTVDELQIKCNFKSSVCNQLLTYMVKNFVSFSAGLHNIGKISYTYHLTELSLVI
jgi:hypothetical protein